VATIRRQLAVFRAERERVGRPFPAEMPAAKEVFCAKDRATALEQAGPYLAGKYRDYAKWGQDKAMPADESFDQGFEELLQDRFVLGSPEECYEQLRPYWEELGVNHLVIRTHWAGMPVSTALSSMRLISDELIPALRKV
jgi:alkanesulfonate monooxygenase SsuD/methylene tetrahydromethanopterin reductase-like flavin-dependent oxidoreductase (luciferase family)